MTENAVLVWTVGQTGEKKEKFSNLSRLVRTGSKCVTDFVWWVHERSHQTVDKHLILSAGQYCIYKSGKCPTGLTDGAVFWDDEDSHKENDKGGSLPGGSYGINTRINFCCKTDGNKTVAILLPTKSPFYLLAYKSAKCQMVKWVMASLEWIYYDTEQKRNNDKGRRAYPHNAGKMHPTIYYCYYRGKKTNLLNAFHLPISASVFFQFSK